VAAPLGKQSISEPPGILGKLGPVIRRRHATVRAAWHTTVAQWGLASFRENWRFKMRQGLYNARFVTPAV